MVGDKGAMLSGNYKIFLGPNNNSLEATGMKHVFLFILGWSVLIVVMAISWLYRVPKIVQRMFSHTPVAGHAEWLLK